MLKLRGAAPPTREGSAGLAVDLAAVADLDDFDDALPVINGVQDTVVALADSIAFLPGEFLAAGRAGILDQELDPTGDAPDIGLGQ